MLDQRRGHGNQQGPAEDPGSQAQEPSVTRALARVSRHGANAVLALAPTDSCNASLHPSPTSRQGQRDTKGAKWVVN